MQFIEIICDLYKLGKLKQAFLCVDSHQLWRVQTKKSSYAIKQLSSDATLIKYSMQGERIAEAFAKHDMAVVTAFSHENQRILEVDDQKFLIFKWHAGEVLSADAVAALYAYTIGNLLAHLHLTKIDLPDVTLARWQNFQINDYQDLLELIPQKRIANLIKNILPQLNLWLEKYLFAKQQSPHSLVISHGDLLQANVIWDNDKPWLIDWEAAGWLHPQIELIGVLSNWSGINVGDINRESFDNIVRGYQAAGGEINIDENILWASLGSWFAWLTFNLRQLIYADKKVENEIIHTAKTLQRLVESFPQFLHFINN